MVVGRDSGLLLDRCVRDYVIFRDEDQCRAWIAVLEESLEEARGALDMILLEKSRSQSLEQVRSSR